MNTSHFKRIFAAITLLGAMPSVTHGAINESLSFPADDMTLTTDTIDGVVYCNVAYSDTYNNGETAQPSLPVRYYTFSIPYNAANLSVSADVLDVNIIPSPATVFPIQVPQLADGSDTPTFTMPDSSVYNTNAFFPSQIASIAGEGYYQGDNHIVTVALCPIQYNPVAGQLRVNNEIGLNISYSLVDESALPMRVVSRNSSSLRTEGINSTKSIVLNPSSVEGFAAPFSPAITPSSTFASPLYDYIIVTSEELAPAFERLVSYKRAKGYNAGIVTMEGILANDAYKNGDTFSGINDDAGKLRAYLYNAYMCGAKYVLLGGKEPHVPIRYGYGMRSYFIPTDLYFCELSSNWNQSKDSYYGKQSLTLDYCPELFVGRLLCDNISEVNNYIDKLLKYELNPGNGNYEYLQRSFIIDADQMEDNNEAGYIASEISTLLPDTIVKHGSTDYSSVTEIISDLNTTHHGYLSFHGHGNPGCIVLCGKSVIGAIDNDHEKDWYRKKESGNALDNLTNKDYPNICYSISCSTMPYDIYTEDSTTYNVSMNFGESFTLGKNYGGVAYLGNTRYGFYDLSLVNGYQNSVYLEKCFIEQLKSGVFNIGKAEANSKIKDFSPYLSNTHSHDIRLTHNLLGDPEFEIWTGSPVKYTDADIDIYRDGSKIMVSGSCLDGAKIVVRDTNDNPHISTGQKNGSTTFYASPNSSIMIYRHNMIPYIPTLCLQNENIYVSQRVFATDVKMGANVDGNRAYGNIAFCNNAKYTIDATGDVEINHGFIVQNTATVTINTPGIVTIKGGLVNSGGSLIINAAEVIMDGDFTAENGAEVKIEKISY